MRKYELFVIKEEVARHYFGRERLIYELFYDYQHASPELRKILQKQINYITVPISFENEKLNFISEIYRLKNIQLEMNRHWVAISKHDSKAVIIFHENGIQLETFGDYELEMIVFEILRKYQPYYIAVDMDKKRYGWLKPIKERKLV